MRGGRPAAMLAAMPKTPRRISLSIEEDRPLRGHVADDGGPLHAFEGWLELLSALGHLLDDPEPGAEPSPPSTNTDPGDHRHAPHH